MTYSTDLPATLNLLAGTVGLDAQGAANQLADTTNLDLLAALNIAAGTVGLEMNAAVRALALAFGITTTLDYNSALNSITATDLDFLLREDGSYILRENGSRFIMEEIERFPSLEQFPAVNLYP